MSDIFISYSRKDSEQALQLAERLQGEGMSVWIDQRGIEAAKSWSGEIVDAIEGCKAFLILLSSHSMQSENVAKELSIAFENKRKLLPVAIEDVALAREFKYPLAGVQRVAYTQFDAIRQALVSIGVRSIIDAKKQDARITLMILPFDDLSPTQDNGWFADGIVSELISALSNIKALKLIDVKATKAYKTYLGSLTSYAGEMSISYFVQGDVRKFGSSIKISARLLDIRSGDYLWQDSLKGTMEDVFDIQEQVALRVVEGLKVHLATGEEQKLSEHGTENPEAYELFLKATDFFYRETKEDLQHALATMEHALVLDPNFARAISGKAQILTEIYRRYDQDPNHLSEAEQLIDKALKLKPDLWGAYGSLATIYLSQQRENEAEQTVKHFAQMAPEGWASHFAVGFYYGHIGEYQLAIEAYERSLELEKENIAAIENLVLAAKGNNDLPRVNHWSNQGIRLYERALRMRPDDVYSKSQYVSLLLNVGETPKAREVLDASSANPHLDCVLQFNLALLYARLNDQSSTLRLLQWALRSGLPLAAEKLADNEFDFVRDLPEFQLMLSQIK